MREAAHARIPDYVDYYYAFLAEDGVTHNQLQQREVNLRRRPENADDKCSNGTCNSNRISKNLPASI